MMHAVRNGTRTPVISAFVRRHVAKRIGDGLPISVAGEGLLGWPAAHAAFAAAVTAALPDPEPVQVLGIDETRRGKPRWTRTEDGDARTKMETFETNFVDLAGTHGLLRQASGRTKATVIAWLDERGRAWKDAVEVVAMDPCAIYRAAVAEALPSALKVADHSHLVRVSLEGPYDPSGGERSPPEGCRSSPKRRPRTLECELDGVTASPLHALSSRFG